MSDLDTAIALYDAGRLAEALVAFEAVEAATPGNAGVALLIGTLHWQFGNLDQAALALETSVERRWDAMGLNQLGLVRKAQGRHQDAIDLFREALTLGQDDLEPNLNLAMTLQESGDADTAATHLDAFAARHPSPAVGMLNALLLPIVLESAERIEDWRQRVSDRLNQVVQRGGSIADPLNEVGLMQFHLAYQCRNDVALQQQIAQTYLKLCPALGWRSPNLAQPGGRDRIKVGFVSANLRSHTVGWLNVGFIEHLDRTKFEVHVIAPPGAPNMMDPLRDRIEGAADQVLAVPRDLAQAREVIARQAYDVLYYPDIGMDAFTYYLAFARLAPVQAVAWGHPVTTGIPNMDYFVSSNDMEPGGGEPTGREPENGEAAYSETLVRLPDVGAYLLAPEKPTGQFDRAAHGLPVDQPLLVCLQSCFKFHPDFDETLKRILEAVPEAVLVLLTGSPRTPSDLLRARLERSLGEGAARIRFVGPLQQEDYLHLTADATAVLDVPQWAGGRSSYECLAMGAPLVHQPGPFMRGRHTLAFYRAMGMDACLADSADTYVEIVTRLARDAAFNAAVRQQIAEKAPALFERKSAVVALEQFFLDATKP